MQPGEYVRGLKHVTSEDYYCAITHPRGAESPKQYFLPAFIGETLGQLAAWNVMVAQDFKRRPVAGIAHCARIFRPAYVGETIFLESIIDSLDDFSVQYHSTASVKDEVIFEIEGAIGPLLPMEDFIDESRVRRQFSEIYRPLDKGIPEYCNVGDAIGVPLVSRAFFSYDRILASIPGECLAAVKCVSLAAPYFSDHFPNSPVLPMTVLLACKEQLLQEFLKRAAFSSTYHLFEMRRIKMNEFVRPGDVVVTHLSLKKQDEHNLMLHCISEVEGKRVCSLEFHLTAGSQSL